MSYTFNTNQQAELRAFWLELGCPKGVIDGYINELVHYLDTTSELITNSNKKIESKENRDYLNVAKQCEKLLNELKKIPELDRINLLSVRENRPEYGGRIMSIIDPFSYVEAIQELAKHHSYELNKCSKYYRQLHGLKTFLSRFPQCKDLKRVPFLKLFCILYKVTKILTTMQKELLIRLDTKI